MHPALAAAAGQKRADIEAERRSAVPVAGDYAHREEHREGQVQLEVRGRAEYATFQTVRSPVQYFAREQPAVFFTVPAGSRPAIPITWEVDRAPVGTEGQPVPERRDIKVFRLHVDAACHVRHVDESGVDGLGYLQYQNTMAWPLAGTDPMYATRLPGSSCPRSRRLP